MYRSDLTEDEVLHSRLLSSWCENVSRRDFVEVVRYWDEFRLTVLSRRLIVVRPGATLEDYVCLYYGDELQDRFGVDFTGKTFSEIQNICAVSNLVDAYRLVAKFKIPSISRVLPVLRGQQGENYTRIIHPILSGDEVRFVTAILSFHD